jgi:hypothetical protein
MRPFNTRLNVLGAFRCSVKSSVFRPILGRCCILRLTPIACLFCFLLPLLRRFDGFVCYWCGWCG